MEKDFKRQTDLFDPAKFPDLSVVIVGAGGIGGPTTLAIAKLGITKIKVYDFDAVEVHNQPNQLYGTEDVGFHKVTALEIIIRQLADVNIKSYRKKVTHATKLSGVVIGAVDSMDARRAIWSAVKKAGKAVPLYIDGRLGEQVIRVLTVRPGIKRDVKRYEQSIVPNHAVAPMRCTAAGIIDVSFAVASLITRALRMALVNNKIIGDLIYDHRNLRYIKE